MLVAGILDEYSTIIDAGARRPVLSDRRPRHWRGMDAGHRPLRRYRWIFLVAELTRRQFAFNEIFTVVAVAAVIAASRTGGETDYEL